MKIVILIYLINKSQTNFLNLLKVLKINMKWLASLETFNIQGKNHNIKNH